MRLDDSPGWLAGALLLLAALLLATVVARSFDPDYFNHDVAWLLHCAGRILDGVPYFTGWMDVNPPGTFWLAVPAVALARRLGTQPILVYDLGVWLATLLSAALCVRILVREPHPAPPGYALALAGVFGAAWTLLPDYDYGQREHLLAILTAPYLFAAALRLRGGALPPRFGAAVGVLAGVGLALKPHFLLMWAAVECLVGWRRGAAAFLCSETLAIASVHALYAASVLLITPEYLEALGIGLAVYDAYSAPLGSFLLNGATRALLLALLLAALLRPTSLNAEERRVLLLSSATLLAVGILQHKGWSYHFVAARLLAVLAIAVTLLGLLGPGSGRDALERLVRPPARRLPLLALWLAVAWSVVQAAVAVDRTWGSGPDAPSAVRQLNAIVATEAQGEPVLALSSSMILFPTVNLTGSPLASRFDSLWLLPGFYTPEERAAEPFRYRSPEEMGERERAYLDAVVEDMRAADPALLLVDYSAERQGFGRSSFDFLEYFLRDPRFAQAFRRYRHLRDLGPYRFYERIEPRQEPAGP